MQLVEGLKRKDRGLPRRKELCLRAALGLKTAVLPFALFASLPACSAYFEIASLHNHVSQLKK